MVEFRLRPSAPRPLTGEEAIVGTDATVLDFWRFAMSYFTMNNVRGYLAEFLQEVDHRGRLPAGVRALVVVVLAPVLGPLVWFRVSRRRP